MEGKLDNYKLNFKTNTHFSDTNNTQVKKGATKSKGRMKRFFENAGMSLLSILIACLIGEGVLRVFYPQKLGTIQFSNHTELGLLPVPSQEGFNFYPGVYNYNYTNDEHARRITSKDKMTGANKTVMLIGDSFTYGIGVNDEQTFAYKLQDHQKADGVKIVNAGTQGKGTDYVLRYYQEFKDQVKPDAVYYMAHFNDVQDNFREFYYYKDTKNKTLKQKTFDDSFFARKKSISKSSVYRWFNRNSQLFSLVKSFVVTVMMPAHVIAYEESFENQDAYKFTDIILDSLTTELKNDGVEFHMYYIPHENDMKVLKAENKLRGPENYFKTYCEKNGVNFNSFTPEMINAGTIEELYLLEGHWTPKGHEVAGDLMNNYLQSQK